MKNNLPNYKSGDLIMLLEALKTDIKIFNHTNIENKFDKDNEILLYETLVLYQDKEDSLYFRINVFINKLRIKYMNSILQIEMNLF